MIRLIFEIRKPKDTSKLTALSRPMITSSIYSSEEDDRASDHGRHGVLMESAEHSAVKSLYPSSVEVERTFRFLHELEKEEASYMSMSLESLSQSNKTDRSSLHGNNMLFSDSARTTMLSSQESLNEYSPNGPLNSKLDTDEKSKIRNFLQESADLFSGREQRANPERLLYPQLNRAVTDQPMHKAPIFFPKFSRESSIGSQPLYPSEMHNNDPPPFYSINIPQFEDRINEYDNGNVSVKENNIHSQQLLKNENNMNANVITNNKNRHALQTQDSYHHQDQVDFNFPNSLNFQQLFIHEDPESPECSQKELKVIDHRHSDPSLSTSRLYVSSQDDVLSEQLKRSVSEGEQKNYKRDLSRKTHFPKRKSALSKVKSSITKNRKEEVKTGSDAKNAITCLGCMRILVGRKSAKLVSCPVCRVVTPNKTI